MSRAIYDEFKPTIINTTKTYGHKESKKNNLRGCPKLFGLVIS